MDETKKYYTYILRRPDKLDNGDPMIFYVGKGHGARAYNHTTKSSLKSRSHKNSIIKKLLNENINVPVEFILENVSEKEAFDKEIELIKKYGRYDLGTGILSNKTNGGEGSSGTIVLAKTRKKISIANTGHIVSAETRKKLSIANTRENNPNWGNTGENSPIWGKTGKNSPSWGRKASDKTRKKMSIALAGKNNPNWGKKASSETRSNLSIAKQKFKLTREELVMELKNRTIKDISKIYNVGISTVYDAKKRFNITKEEYTK